MVQQRVLTSLQAQYIQIQKRAQRAYAILAVLDRCTHLLALCGEWGGACNRAA